MVRQSCPLGDTDVPYSTLVGRTEVISKTGQEDCYLRHEKHWVRDFTKDPWKLQSNSWTLVTDGKVLFTFFEEARGKKVLETLLHRVKKTGKILAGVES